MFKLIVVLTIFISAAYLLLKTLKKKQLKKVSPNKMIQVIDGVQVGMREEIILMKVGKEYILLSSNSGQMLALNQEEIMVPNQNFDELLVKENPSLALKDLVKGLKDGLVKK
jgi:flagellar biogenesis protein FliO